MYSSFTQDVTYNLGQLIQSTQDREGGRADSWVIVDLQRMFNFGSRVAKVLVEIF